MKNIDLPAQMMVRLVAEKWQISLIVDKSFLEIFTADKGWFGLIEISGNYVREDRACGHAGPQRSAQTRVNPRRRFFRVDWSKTRV